MCVCACVCAGVTFEEPLFLFLRSSLPTSFAEHLTEIATSVHSVRNGSQVQRLSRASALVCGSGLHSLTAVRQIPLGEQRFIRVPNGKKVLLGRGHFLGLTDETISRAQAELYLSSDGSSHRPIRECLAAHSTLSGTSLTITGLKEQDGSFVKNNGESEFYELPHGEPCELLNLDVVSVVKFVECVFLSTLFFFHRCILAPLLLTCC